MYFKAPGRYLTQGSPALAWGDFTIYLEVADDQFALRQVNEFEDGSILRYNREYRCDDYGQLYGGRFSRKPKWAKFFPKAKIISVSDFVKIWRVAGRSQLWQEQLAHSRVLQWGSWRFG
jgi:hypothetical protein